MELLGALGRLVGLLEASWAHLGPRAAQEADFRAILLTSSSNMEPKVNQNPLKIALGSLLETYRI